MGLAVRWRLRGAAENSEGLMGKGPKDEAGHVGDAGGALAQLPGTRSGQDHRDGISGVALGDFLDVTVVAGDDEKGFGVQLGPKPPQETVHPLQGGDGRVHSPLVASGVGGVVSEECQIHIVCDASQVPPGVFKGDFRYVMEAEALSPGRIDHLAGYRVPRCQMVFMTDKKPGAFCGQGWAGGSLGPGQVVVLAGVGVCEGTAGTLCLCPGEDILFHYEGPQWNRNPGPEVATIESGSVPAREEGRVARAALRKSIHTHEGVQRYHHRLHRFGDGSACVRRGSARIGSSLGRGRGDIPLNCRNLVVEEGEEGGGFG